MPTACLDSVELAAMVKPFSLNFSGDTLKPKLSSSVSGSMGGGLRCSDRVVKRISDDRTRSMLDLLRFRRGERIGDELVSLEAKRTSDDGRLTKLLH